MVRLPSWFRPAPDERQRAIATLKSLGTTSVPGLAAALSWSVPKTEKVLWDVSRHGPPGLLYDLRSGTIRWGSPVAAPPKSTSGPAAASSAPSWAVSAARSSARPSPNPPAAGSASVSRVGSYRPTVVPPAPSPPARIAPGDHLLRECARCHTPLVPAGGADEFACPMCGRRVTSAGTLVSPSPSRATAPAGPDPRVQQLIAAWATGQPAPCPQCRQPLRHTTNGEFRCGSCGARIAYDPPAASPAPVSGVPVVGPSH
ncbi:MAG: hypothetical protein L3K14_01595 [Thermoplasmata archaeon]|nr:hypothetical protein [Thermoplasmata archaeon]